MYLGKKLLRRGRFKGSLVGALLLKPFDFDPV